MKRETLTVCPWNVLMGRSCPSLQTWIHMSVLHEANVLLLCQSTSRAGAEGSRDRVNTLSYMSSGGQKTLLRTWMERKLLLGFSRVSVPYDGCLVKCAAQLRGHHQITMCQPILVTLVTLSCPITGLFSLLNQNMSYLQNKVVLQVHGNKTEKKATLQQASSGLPCLRRHSG